MSLDFVTARTRLGVSVQRDDLASSYGDFINEALKEIQDRRSWTCMKKTTQVTINPGENPVAGDLGTDSEGSQTATLPADFKELQKQPAVHYVADDGGFIPADVVTEAEQIHRIWAFGGTPVSTWPPRVFYERNGTDAVLGVIEPITQALNFRVKYFSYLPDLAADGDTSPFLTLYPKMVLAKAKAIAFTEINDPAAIAAEEEFEKKLGEAIRQDAYSEVAGRVLHM